MHFELLHPADQLVMMMNRIYYNGLTTTSGGNLSIMDDNGDIWITPSSVDKGSLSRDDMICVKKDGTIIGRHKPSVELPFHQSVYQRRHDIKAILHAHPPALVAFSIVREIPDVNLIPTVKLICGDIVIAPYAVPGSDTLGEYLAKEFEKGFSVVMMENHGVCIGAETLFRAFMSFETLEFCARIEMNARRIGTPNSLVPRQIDFLRSKTDPEMDDFVPHVHSSEERAARRDIVKFIRRSYGQHLFTSTQGTYSVRLSDGSFVITPFGKDREYMEEEDLVLIKNGMKEQGKTPSRSAKLHELIYKKHPEINTVLCAHPPHIMAFAVTDIPFDPKTIPESYIQLRDIQKIPYGESYLEMEGTAELLSERCPAIIVENDCIIVTGASLINAFDRLEVAEYTANSIISAGALGDIVHINSAEVDEIDRTFNLN